MTIMMIDDTQLTRPIARVITNDCETGNPRTWELGRNGITKMVAYREYGEYSFIPWIAVYRGDVISERIRSCYALHIIYQADDCDAR